MRNDICRPRLARQSLGLSFLLDCFGKKAYFGRRGHVCSRQHLVGMPCAIIGGLLLADLKSIVFGSVQGCSV